MSFSPQKFRCPWCGKNEFHITEDFTKSVCDACGCEIDYNKIPFLRSIMAQVKDLRDAMSFNKKEDDDKE